MVLIAENIHIISNSLKAAIIRKDGKFILEVAKKAYENGLRIFDLNIGPAKGEISEAFSYLTKLLRGKFDVNFSFDTSNFEKMKAGFLEIDKQKAEKCFLNSVCYEENKLKAGLEIAEEFNPNLIALLFNPDKGIENTSEARFEIASVIYEKALEAGICEDKIYFDPLILPLSVAQNQAGLVLETIRMLKEGLPGVKTIVGLSNISNGSNKEVRPLINRVFMVLCMGAGLTGAIVDGHDKELIRIYNMVKDSDPKSPLDSLYCSLYNAVDGFLDIDEIKFNKNDTEEANVFKAARILLGKEIYSHSFYLK